MSLVMCVFVFNASAIAFAPSDPIELSLFEIELETN